MTAQKCYGIQFFFYNSKVLILRGGREHRKLRLSQFCFGNENGKAYVQFAETGSKNRSESYKDNTSNKVIRHYADSSLGNKCYHHVLSISKRYLKIKKEMPFICALVLLPQKTTMSLPTSGTKHP